MSRQTDLGPANRLLATLPLKVRSRLLPKMDLVPIHAGQLLLDRGKISYVHFPVSGVVSKMVQMDDGERIATGMIGNEGMTPLCFFMGLDPTPFRVVVQNPGQALRMPAHAFKKLVSPGHQLHITLLRFAAAFMSQVSQFAACHRLHPLEKRYCRWPLMTHDRVESDQFMLTQQTAAQVMGVRRMSITPIAKKLKDEGLIRYGRGSITILDRKALEAASCECYVRIAHVYDALLEQISQ